MTLNLRRNIVIQTRSASETVQIGKTIGKCLLSGDVVALVGELGAGKTQFIKGLASGVGIEDPTHISSPSFTLIHEYSGKIPFYHIDLFRLGREQEAEELGLEDYFQGRGITAIEWADKIPSLLPEELLFVSIAYVDKNIRSLEVAGKGKHFEDLLNHVRSSGFGAKSPI
jgi:tRNA threonylcarbamoyladenosine biosynthesis protein TsaE